MKYQTIILKYLLTILLFTIFNDSRAQCENPLSLDWIRPYLGASCTDKIYAFEYNDESYIYATSTTSCIAADARNLLYNCNADEFCSIFGFTLPQDQCSEELRQNILPFLTEENVIYPIGVTRDCKNPLQMEWLKPLLKHNCTDGIYAFQHLEIDYIYRSTACEFVDDPNYLYNCATAEICYVQGRTLPDLQCDLTEFPLEDYLIRDNLIWSTPLLELVNEFPWLPGKLNIMNCVNETVSRYEGTDDAIYVSINEDNTTKLYTSTSELYCADRDGLNCLSANNLNEPTAEWACNTRELAIVCEPIDADNLPDWLSEYIGGLTCECGGEILQYCYNDVTYISYEANAPFCADYAGFIFSEDGTQICQNGGITGGDCFTALPGFFETAALVNDLWTCEDCSNLAFESAYLGCGSCCNDEIYYTVTGTTTSYTVTNAISGDELLSGDPPGTIGPNNNIELLVTTSAGCTATTSIPFQPFCCEVPPACEMYNLFYDCEEGLVAEFISILGAPFDYCGEQATFQDQYGNTYQTGDTVINNGLYELTLTNEGNFISPPCATFEVEVQCGNNNPCQLDAGEIISNPDLCGFGIVSLEAEYTYPNGPDDNEYVFVQVNTDDSFEVLRDNAASVINACYYGIHYRFSCDVPNFEASNFSEILDADANYAITPCFEINYISAPEYFITTEPYCDGEGLFTFGVTVTGGSGSYIIGEDYTGETIFGETGENFITYASGLEFYDVFPYDAETGCATDYIIPISDPGCGIFAGSCELAPDPGPCEAYIPRYYFDSDSNNCYKFIYGGCEGNSNNFETYEACIESCGRRQTPCPPHNPIYYTWIQNLIQSSFGCDIYTIDQFDYIDDTYFRTTPYAGPYSCPSDLPYVYYDCQGNEVCKTGFFPPGNPDVCDNEFVDAANNSTTIWTYNFEGCANPFETEIVQNAINNPYCNNAIYSFNYNSNDYVYIQTRCEYIDAPNVLFNCNTGQICEKGGEYIPAEPCDALFNEIEAFLTEENLIWPQQSCAYEHKGIVRDYTGLDGCSFVIELEDSTILEPFTTDSIGFTFNDGDRVELSFRELLIPSICQVGIVGEILCIKAIEEDLGCADPFELEIVQGAINNSSCTEGIYAFTYQNNDYVYISTLCEFVDDSNTLYNCNTGETCYIGGFSFPDEECQNTYSQIQSLINEENLIWSHPCEYAHKGIVRDDPQNGCGYFIELEDGITIEPGSIQGGFTLSEGQQVELSYNIIQPLGFCEADYLVSITCIRLAIDEYCACDDIYDPVCGVDGVTYANACEAECEGVAIAYEGECTNLNCPPGDPLQKTWLQNLIVENAGCLVTEVREFTYQGIQHYVTYPGYPPNLICASDAPVSYYNCEGEFVCEIGFFPPDTPTLCNDSIVAAANNARVIWTYNETNCADPFELEIVQNAIEFNSCTGGIYAFDFEGESYIYISTLCEAADASNILYNCNTGIACSIGGFTIPVEACYNNFEEISNLINDENLIWSPSCEYKHTGTVIDYSGFAGCGFLIELDDSTILEPLFVEESYNFYDGQRVELSYEQRQIPSICQVGIVVEILCLREIEEELNCSDPFELEIVKGAINNSSCTEGIYAFTYENNDYVFISTLCEFVDASNTLYNCNTGKICYIGGFGLPGSECQDIYNQVQPLINDENLIWSHPCEYEHKGIVIDDPQNGCGYFIELYDSTRIEPGSIQGEFTLEEGQEVELSYNIIQPLGFCAADYLVSITCIRLLGEGLSCSDPFELEIVQAAVNDTCTGGIYAFSYQNNNFIYIDHAKNTVCEFEDVTNTLYNCNTGKICNIGGFAFPNEECDEIFNLVEPLINDENLIWFREIEEEKGCDDPFELEIVQNAINYPQCTGGIYAFNYQNEDYVYIQTLCEFVDDSSILYNCSTNETCYIGGDQFYSPECEDFFREIEYLVNDENSIWSRPCNYEYSGTVIGSAMNGCGRRIKLTNGTIIEPITVSQNFTFYEGQQVELSYNVIQPGINICESDSMVNIICVREIEEECICTLQYEPVCGVDGNTYSNPCFAACAGVTIDYKGECEKQCDCPAVYEPVCGADGITYANICFAICDSVEIVYEGECKEPCLCPEYYQPVCGVDGITYGNPCFAECEGVEIAYDGICTEPCECEVLSYEPVCGTDGLTYDNECLAECAGVEIISNGECIEPCQCGDTYGYAGLVCGVDGQTYANECDALCAGVEVAYEGKCPEPCGCEVPSFEPVCGVNGVTYDNECLAECAGVEIVFKGDCTKTCDCETFGVLPVCGVNGITYDNECLAECVGVEIAYEGECEALNNEIFDEYPWLLNIVDPVNCASGVTISVYMEGRYSFIYVEYPESEGILYFESGRLYCDDELDNFCIDAYELTDLVASWSCSDKPTENITATFSNLTCNDDGTFSIDVTAEGAFSGTYGIYGSTLGGDAPEFFNFDEGETFTFTGSNFDAQKNRYILYIYDYYLADAGATPFEINIEECSAPPENITAVFSNLTCNDNNTFSIDLTATGALSGTYGIYGTSDLELPVVYRFEEGETYTFTGVNSRAENNLYTLYIYNYFLSHKVATPFEINIEECIDDNTSSAIFDDYPWLFDIVDPTNCASGVTISVYMQGRYSFIYVQYPGDEGILYFENGRLYCDDELDDFCIDAYELTNLVASWSCEDQPTAGCNNDNPTELEWLQEIIDTRGSNECDLKEVKIFDYEGEDYIYLLSYPIYPNCPTDTGGSSIYDCNGNLICNFGYFGIYYQSCDQELIAASGSGELVWEYTGNIIAEKYPWIYDIVNPSECFDTRVREYDNGHFAYITVENEDGLKLYYDDGSLFCKDNENLSCVEFYELEEVTATWNCEFANNEKNESKKLALADGAIKIYPNPNKGVFTIDLANIKSEIQKIEIYDIAGKQHNLPINLNKTNTSIKVDAKDLKNGSYIITVFTANKTLHSETVIIH